jgi:hypothetical protein
MIEGYTLQAWRDPSKVVITKGRWHGGAWLITIFGRRTVEVDTWGQAVEYARLIGCFGPRWRR